MEPETICNLPMIKAEYRRIEPITRPAHNGFRIGLRPSGHHQGKVDVDEIDAMQFAAELEAVAAVIRARVLGHREPLRKAD